MGAKLFLIVLVAVIALDGVVGPKPKGRGTRKVSKATPSRVSQEAHNDNRMKAIALLLADVLRYVEMAYLQLGVDTVVAMNGHPMERFIGYCTNKPRDLPDLDVLTCNHILGLFLYYEMGGMDTVNNMTRVANLTSEENEAFDKIKINAGKLEEMTIKMFKTTFALSPEVPIQIQIPWMDILNACLAMEDKPAVAFLWNVAKQQLIRSQQEEKEEI